MGFQFLGPRSTVLSPSDPRPPTVPWAAWNMGPASVDSMLRTIRCCCSDWKMGICQRLLMILPSCKAYGSPVREWMEYIPHWRDAMRGWEGRDTFLILRIFTGRFGGFGLVCVCLFVCFILVWPVEILHSISVSLFCGFPVVDRPCPVLARQCRKKNVLVVVWCVLE